MSADQHLSALRDYDGAVAELYEAPLGTRVAAAEDEAPGPAPDESRVEAVVRASEALIDTTQALLVAEHPLVPESGEARLAALAARDIAMAFDIARLDEEERPSIAAADLSGPALPAIERELAFVLETDPTEGVPAPPWLGGGAQLASVPADPRQALRESLPAAIDSVRDDATAMVMAGLTGLVGGQLGDMLGHLATGLLDKVPTHVKHWYRWALRLLRSGIEKLRRLFGSLFDKAMDKLKDWVKDHAATKVADVVYGTAELRSHVEQLVDDATGSPNWDQIAEEVQRVVDKFGTQKTVVMAVFKALGFARNWILRAIAGPTGELVVGGAFALGTAYGLFSGGDYVDWRRTDDDGAFDFVRGVRRTAEHYL